VINVLKDLYLQDLENYPVGAVYDNYVIKNFELGIMEEGNYFNSGVLLIDVDLWNEQHISDKAIKFLQEYPEKIKFVDQDALNAVLINNWKKLDWKFNVIYTRLPYSLSKNEMQLFIKDKVIIHFTIQRPWLMLCKNRYRNLYFYYLKKSQIKIRKRYVDFSWTKIPAYLKIRLLEWYLDSTFVQKIWRKFKKVKTNNL
jgi:lipopolysaccharide biosynthesis glycosyltransferase